VVTAKTLSREQHQLVVMPDQWVMMPVVIIENPDEQTGCLMSAFLVVFRDQVSVSLNHFGCSLALRFV